MREHSETIGPETQDTKPLGVQLNGKRVLVGACGAVNIINLHRYLLSLCCIAKSVNVIATKAALNMICETPIKAITGNSVYTDVCTNGLAVPYPTPILLLGPMFFS
jgi:hypothetical protein